MRTRAHHKTAAATALHPNRDEPAVSADFRRFGSKPRFVSAALSFSLFLGCGTGQIGGEVNSGGEGSVGAGCEISGSQSVSDTEETSIGISGQDARGLLEGEYEASLAWVEGVMQISGVSVTPEAGKSQMHVTIEVIEGSTKLLDVEVAKSDGLEGGALFAPLGDCRDLLSVDANVTLQAENGAFDDTFPATFVLDSMNLARTVIPLTLGELEGSFDASPPPDHPNAEITQVSVSLNVTPQLVSGEISGGLEETDGQVASYAGLTFGKFPAENSCSAGVPLAKEGSLFSEASAAAMALRDFDLTWADGEMTTVSLDTEVLGACYDAIDDPTVILSANTHVLSADGSLDGSWDLEAQVTMNAQGEPTKVTLLRQAYLANIYEAGSFEVQTGISKFPLDPTLEATFSFSVTDDLSDDLPASGEITVMEVTPADCTSQEPAEPSAGGGASPGCAGNQVEEIGGATLLAKEG